MTFKPTDPTVTYFYTMVDKAGYDDISKDWPAYIYEYMVSRWEKTPSLSLEDIVGICCVTGEWTSEGRELTPKTTYYACAVGVNAQAQINTDVTVVEIVTPEETPIDYAFDFAVSDITANGATVTVTPHDVRAFYYWNVMTEAEYRELGRDEAKIAVWFRTNDGQETYRAVRRICRYVRSVGRLYLQPMFERRQSGNLYFRETFILDDILSVCFLGRRDNG